MVNHEDYIKLSEKIDTLCKNTRENFDGHIERVHARVDTLNDALIRHDERLKVMENMVTQHMNEEEKRWKTIMRWLVFLSAMHIIEFTDSFPQLIALMKAAGL